MPQRLRIFISSPGDVEIERLRTSLVIDKLSQDYSRFFTIESYLWEHEPMRSSAHFQDAIELPSSFDVVLLILWSRLGTLLPERTAAREYRGIDGRVPVTGTEWEYEEALASSRKIGLPDLLVFRNISNAPIDTRDADARARSNAQLDALDAFWQLHFEDHGIFRAAYDSYGTIDQFSARLEESLRKLIERRIKAAATGSAAPAAPVWLGMPFRGLEPYEFEHAAIFFGRDGLITRAMEQLVANARAGTAFLLISGSSGSGKSSLVKAALVPRLMKPQRISGAAFLRRVTIRAGAVGPDLILGLARALVASGGATDVGLPELVGPGQNVEQLATNLRAVANQPGFLIGGALGRLTEAARGSGRMLAFEEPKLVLGVDQLEELFTVPGIDEKEIRLFIELLGGLARSGEIWVIATLRADFWHRAANVPELLALAEGTGRLDVAPPQHAELEEMIRKPAEAAGISFETHPNSGLRLDAVLTQHAAAEPGVLPLLSFTLDELCRRASGRGETVLTFADYEALGGIEGAIAKRAEDTLAALPDAARMALPRVLRALVTVSAADGHVPVSRAAPLAAFDDDNGARHLVEALISARLLVAEGGDAAPSVRLAHEALIGRWQRAKEQLAADRRDLETRGVIEEQFNRWRDAKESAGSQLLLRNPDLASGIDLARRWRDELDPEMRDYIQRSRRRARLAQTLTAAAALVFALVAVAAIFEGVRAYRAQLAAQATLTAATETANSLVFDLADKFRNVLGVPATLVEAILDHAEELQNQLVKSGQVTPALRRSQAAALIESVNTLLAIGKTDAALAAAEQAREIDSSLLASNPDDPNQQAALAIDHERVGDVLAAQDKPNDALKSYRDEVAIFEALVKSAPGNTLWQFDLSVADRRMGEILQRNGQLDGSLQFLRQALALMISLTQSDRGNARWQRDLSVSYETIGDLMAAQHHPDDALKSYRSELAIIEGLAVSNPDNAGWQNDLAIAYEKIADMLKEGNHLDDALDAYRQDIVIRQRLAQADPGNATWQHDLGIADDEVGNVLRAEGKLADALKSFRAEAAILTVLIKFRPGYTGWQKELATVDDKIGDVLREQKQFNDALASYRESLAIREGLIKSDPQDTASQRGLVGSYQRLAYVYAHLGDRGQALNALQSGKSIAETQQTQSPNNPYWAGVLIGLDMQISTLTQNNGAAPDAAPRK
jgi:eukaryotic-like serine/threonine-protein kinase